MKALTIAHPLLGTLPGGYFTKDGKKIPGSDFTPPKEANDMEAGRREVVIWTKDGRVIGVSIGPRDANDIHFGAGRLLYVGTIPLATPVGRVRRGGKRG